MVLGNQEYYEIGFRKSNGSISYIRDKSTGKNVTLGSRYESLWGAVFEEGTPDYVGGGLYDSTSANHFGYTWSNSSKTLILDYTPNKASSQYVTAKVTITASELPWFDMHLHLQNHWGYRLDYVLFPSDLVITKADIKEVILPVLPGIVLKPSFFQQNRTYTAKYPGYPGLFADYVSLSSTAGHMAIYSLYGSEPLRPVVIGFINDNEYIADTTFYYHTFGAGVSNGNSWESPRVRIRISQPASDTIAAFRFDNGLDRFQSLTHKAGVYYDQIVQSPLLKIDAVQWNIPFTEYLGRLIEVPSPGILHPVAFQLGGHDKHYPDFLPPDPSWGTTAQFAAMLRQAQGLGFLVMPYTNPTWWDDGSPTLRAMPEPLTISDIAVLDRDGQPVYEYYDSRGGYVVSPHAPFVQQRLAQLVREMTIDLPSDLLFEDQVGARPWLFDYGHVSPSVDAYIEGWIEHTRTFNDDILLMTELGFDRLVEYEVGFHGSVLLPEKFGYTSDWWGDGNWRPYPLAPLLARDKVLFYQHDLAPETMTADKATLTWNLAFGYMLSYDLGYGGGLGNPWLDLVSAFQKRVLARYASEPMTGFHDLEAKATLTTFETFTVIANWNEASRYDIGPYTLSPQGVLVTNVDGSLVAGVFDRYNNVPLSAGDHYLIEERESDAILISQPLGADTSLTLSLLPGWAQGDPIQVWAYAANGCLIDSVPVTVTAQTLTFTYRQEIAGQRVVRYRAFRPHRVNIPVTLRGS